MKKNSVVITAVLYSVAVSASAFGQTPGAPAATPAAGAAAPTKIAVISLSEAMARTKEGQKAAAELNTKFGPKKAEYDRRQQEIEQLTDKLNKGRATMSEDAQRQLSAEIQTKTTNWKRFGEDAQNDVDAEEQRITGEIQTKMQPILQKYAIDNNLSVVLDIGSQNTSVLWFASATNITDIMIALYDQAHPVSDVPAAAKPPAAPPTKK